jgi:hypothetical protein
MLRPLSPLPSLEALLEAMAALSSSTAHWPSISAQQLETCAALAWREMRT